MTYSTNYIANYEEKENIRRYKYDGRDDGLSYNYIFSPLCNKTLPYLPVYLAYINI